MKITFEEYLDTIGEKGSTERLEAISILNLGNRSEAARRALEKRWMRKEWIDKGVSFETVVLIVEKEYNN